MSNHNHGLDVLGAKRHGNTVVGDVGVNDVLSFIPFMSMFTGTKSSTPTAVAPGATGAATANAAAQQVQVQQAVQAALASAAADKAKADEAARKQTTTTIEIVGGALALVGVGFALYKVVTK